MLETNLSESLAPKVIFTDLSLSQEEASSEAFLETVLGWAQSTVGEDEIIRAREEFFWKAGKVFHDDVFFDARITYFLDYFLMQRPLSGIVSTFEQLTPLESYLRQKTAATAKLENVLQGFYHSAFQVLKVSEREMTCENLVTRERLKIHARKDESLKVIRKNDIFQGFLYKCDHQNHLSHGIIFHPQKAFRLIKKRFKNFLKKDASDTLTELFRLARQNLKYLRHPNVDPKKIYADMNL